MYRRVASIASVADDPKRTSTGLKSRGAVGLPHGRGVLSFRSEARETLGSETPRVHSAHRRRDGGLAARGTRAAGSEAPNDWLPGPDDTFVPEPTYRCFCAALERTRLDRRSRRCNRCALG